VGYRNLREPGNAEVPWDKFDSAAYFAHNYAELRADDAEIIRVVAGFFDRYGAYRKRDRAIDVGPGTNLSPALTMLPFADTVVLCEHAPPNRRWLKDQLRAPAASWTGFWNAISDGRPGYQSLAEPLKELDDRAEVRTGNIFDLRPEHYDLGTMFFVAESITARRDEFQDATTRFVRSLVTGAPFAAAFMRQSSGYSVGGRFFPACAIDENDVRTVLSDVADIADIHVVESESLRPGYRGMIVATGFTNRR